MALANTGLRITELDFDEIKQNIKDYLSAQEEFNDYNFEGSGLSILIDVLAYNTHYNGMYLNFVGNEMFLDTAQLRTSLLSLSKLTNYVPTSRRGSIATVNIVVTPESPEDTSETSLVMDEYTRFLSEPVDGVTYNFVTTQSYQVNKVGDTFTFNNVRLTQGDYVEQVFTVTEENTKRRFNLPSTILDTSTIVVTVQNSEVDDTTVRYTEANDITELTANSTVYFVEEDPENAGTYTLYFGDGYIGKRLLNGNIVTVKYLDVSGLPSNGADTFTNIDAIGTLYSQNVVVTTVSSAAAGGSKETVEDIRYRAPIHYSVQNRAVTKSDYQVLLQKDYPYVESVSVWGGEDNIPVQYGKVFVSLKPRENYDISLTEKERIANEIISTRSVLTVTPEIVDPDYTYIKIEAKVHYNPRLTSKTEGQLKDEVRTAILDYRDTYLRRFDSTFRKSVLQRIIDNADPSIINNTLQFYMQKRIEPELNVDKNYQLNFNMPLSKGDFDSKLFAFPTFTVEDVAGVQRVAYLEEVPASFTGVDSIQITNPGVNYTSAPTVTITGDGTGATATAKITNGKVSSITVTNKGSEYTTATVNITGGNGFGATARARISLSKGILRTFYVKENGEKSFINNNVGTIDYLTGQINLNNFKPIALSTNGYYASTVLTVNIPPEETTIYPIRNRILDIDADDSSVIDVIMIPEN